MVFVLVPILAAAMQVIALKIIVLRNVSLNVPRDVCMANAPVLMYAPVILAISSCCIIFAHLFAQMLVSMDFVLNL